MRSRSNIFLFIIQKEAESGKENGSDREDSGCEIYTVCEADEDELLDEHEVVVPFNESSKHGSSFTPGFSIENIENFEIE